MPLAVKELESDPEIEAAFPLMASLRDRVRRDTFLPEVRRQQKDGYRLFAGFDGGRLVALAGVRRGHTLSRGAHLFVDDLVTEDDSRGKGYGRAMMRWLAALAAGDGLKRIYLDSRASANGFYAKIGFTFLTSTPAWIDVDALNAANTGHAKSPT